jgi:nicotinate-nucleotide adenylyltransferase
VLVAARPGHRGVIADAQSRFELAKAAFRDLPRTRVELDDHPYTVDAVRGGRFGDAVFVVGGDEGAAFSTWKDPAGILEWVRLGIGTRSGYAPPDLARYGDRVVSFELDSPPISSSEVRERVARGASVDELVPAAVAQLLADRGLYRDGSPGYTST